MNLCMIVCSCSCPKHVLDQSAEDIHPGDLFCESTNSVLKTFQLSQLILRPILDEFSKIVVDLCSKATGGTYSGWKKEENIAAVRDSVGCNPRKSVHKRRQQLGMTKECKERRKNCCSKGLSRTQP